MVIFITLRLIDMIMEIKDKKNKKIDEYNSKVNKYNQSLENGDNPDDIF